MLQPIDHTNTLFSLAASLVNHTNKNIFITGKAGTGKTTFLKHIRDNSSKQMAIVAPTGVAAINAGGVTIHSFFQLPFTPFLPEASFRASAEDTNNSHTLLGRLRLNSERRKILQQLELLIIDEISMVRCDVLDAIDLVLRHVRHNYKESFGGVQVMFVGDMYQLAPVAKADEWSLLSEYYHSPYFFDSKVLQEAWPVYIEFTKIYRQSDATFINLLNQVRNNLLDESGVGLLQSRFLPEADTGEHSGYIILTTHNEKARSINTAELAKLPGNSLTFTAEMEGDFSESSSPADVELHLKPGAQVMFLKNDTEKVRRYFNGKIGKVTALEADKIIVTCTSADGEIQQIEVQKEKWENIRYTLNKATRQVDEEVLGSFTQYPLRLAWAITIHKSQGLTFEKAVIDAGAAFAPGQVYVALSRCTSLEGLVLKSQLRNSSLLTDPRVVAFSKSQSVEQLQSVFNEAKKNYQLSITKSLFDLKTIIAEVKALKKYTETHHSSFPADAGAWTEALLKNPTTLQSTAEKFFIQLDHLFEQTTSPEENPSLSKRVMAASEYFQGAFRHLTGMMAASPVVTDSRQHAKEFNDMAKEIYVQLSLKTYLLEGFSGKFDVEKYHRRKNTFVTPAFPFNCYAGATGTKINHTHAALYQQLKKLRDDICRKKNLPVYLVLSSKSLEEMCTYLPQSTGELEQISGFGKTKLDAYGQQFLEIVVSYAQEHGLSSSIAEKVPVRKRKQKAGNKTDTKAISYQLYQEGKMPADIAKERRLTLQTVEGHLAHYVRSGMIRVDELVSREKVVLIEPVLKEFSGGSILPVKEKLGNAVTFGEIRLVLASVEREGLVS